MKKFRHWGVALLIFLALLSVAVMTTHFMRVSGDGFAAAGTIAAKEHTLMVVATLLMLLVIVPVLVIALLFAWWYRADNEKAEYTPNWDHSKIDELIWWAIPFEIVLILAALTWTSTHELDPFKPLTADVPPVTVQVIALNWKWLFIYPDERVATVNYLELPVNTPIDFKVTADAPMNGFWIPKLGSQIMAMTGMTTTLYLNATKEGTYHGLSSNFSGDGFSDMRFPVYAVATSTYQDWLATAKTATSTLDHTVYNELRQPSHDVAPTTYRLSEPGLFQSIIDSFMVPAGATSSMKMQMSAMH